MQAYRQYKIRTVRDHQHKKQNRKGTENVFSDQSDCNVLGAFLLFLRLRLQPAHPYGVVYARYPQNL